MLELMGGNGTKCTGPNWTPCHVFDRYVLGLMVWLLHSENVFLKQFLSVDNSPEEGGKLYQELTRTFQAKAASDNRTFIFMCYTRKLLIFIIIDCLLAVVVIPITTKWRYMVLYIRTIHPRGRGREMTGI